MLKEECGLIGIDAPNDEAARLAFFGLMALQHRGQEAAGIATSDGNSVRLHKDTGLVAQVFNEQNLQRLSGNRAIGHTRYSTTGSSSARNAQPFAIETMHGAVAVAHNGNLVNAAQLREQLLERGVGLSSSSDSEAITMMLAAAPGKNWAERIEASIPHWIGAFSLAILTREGVFAVRDPWGFRPLSYGQLTDGGYVFASETSALKTLGCTRITEVLPGQMLHLQNQTAKVWQAAPANTTQALCVFEHVYFSRPDSVWDGLSIHHVRQRFGEELWKENQTKADVVIPVPDSSIPAAIGYARASGLPYNDGLVKNRYIGRTFIEPTQALRKRAVAMKFVALEENLRGQRVVMIDDSIVRGTTSGPLVKMLRDAGAKEVHVRITCPPIQHPCYMGVDMGKHEDLLAHQKTLEEMRQHIQADSLHFLSLEGMMRAVSKPGYCNACFTGNYPVNIERGQTKTGFEMAIGN